MKAPETTAEALANFNRAVRRLGKLLLVHYLILVQRVVRVFHRPPDFVIGNPAAPYLRRWWVIPRNYWFNIYLHQILRSDDDRALHDHPWANCSIVLRGSYTEVTLDPYAKKTWYETFHSKYHDDAQAVGVGGPFCRAMYSSHGSQEVRYVRRAGSFILRKATTPHRLEISDGNACWTLFITGRAFRKWGFHLPAWTYWRDVVKPENPGEWKND